LGGGGVEHLLHDVEQMVMSFSAAARTLSSTGPSSAWAAAGVSAGINDRAAQQAVGARGFRSRKIHHAASLRSIPTLAAESRSALTIRLLAVHY